MNKQLIEAACRKAAINVDKKLRDYNRGWSHAKWVIYPSTDVLTEIIQREIVAAITQEEVKR